MRRGLRIGCRHRVPTALAGRRGAWGLLLLAAVGGARESEGQDRTVSNTLRYGSGYLDVPVASVLSHRTLTATFSGFRVDAASTAVTPEASGWFYDGAASVGLFDRFEVGTTLQSFGGPEAGGDLWGLFGRFLLARPDPQGVGLGGGFRWVSAPDYSDPTSGHQPTRLGIPDSRFSQRDSGVRTELSLYGVATVFLRGLESWLLPEHDVTISLGYGTGMFADGHALEYYAHTSTQGWFAAGSGQFKVTGGTLLSVIGEWNGFDANVGAQVDLGGIRVGAHLLGANYLTPLGTFRSRKVGFQASACFDLGGGGSLRCRPELIPRPVVDTIRIPAPPPDTVLITRPAGPLPEGTPVELCLATGVATTVLVTVQGDTLVGPGRVPLRSIGRALVFPGVYAEGLDAFAGNRTVPFEGRTYSRFPAEPQLDCASIMRVGEHAGVPLFVERTGTRPFGTVYLPMRAGVWRAYRTGG